MAIDLGPEEECSSVDDWPESAFSSQLALIVFTTLSVLLIVGSVSHSEDTGRSSEPDDGPDNRDEDFRGLRSVKTIIKQFFACFSVQANSKHLMAQNSGHRSSNIAYGLQAISIAGLIVAHTCFFGGFFKSASSINRWAEDLQHNSGRLISQLFFNSHLLIESLFFLRYVIKRLLMAVF